MSGGLCTHIPDLIDDTSDHIVSILHSCESEGRKGNVKCDLLL